MSHHHHHGHHAHSHDHAEPEAPKQQAVLEPLPDGFSYDASGTLQLEGVSLGELTKHLGTPTYVYSATQIERNYREYQEAFAQAGLAVQVEFAVKALPNLHVLRLLARLGCGADVVSGGELARALEAGVPPQHISFAGVGKTAAELEQGLRAGVAFNVESEAELELLGERCSSLGLKGRVAFRLNPDVDAHTHAYISTGKAANKFGIGRAAVERAAARAHALGIHVAGLHCHIGSQLLDVAPLGAAVRVLVQTAARVEQLTGTPLQFLNVGGGLGVPYRAAEHATAPRPRQLADALAAALKAEAPGRTFALVAEPGRWLVARTGVLLTRTLLLKRPEQPSAAAHEGEHEALQFAVVDAAMNDLIRPALYQAHHPIVPVQRPAAAARWGAYDVVGPVCESGDFLARARLLPVLAPGQLLAVLCAGAYGMSMSSQYNSRPRACEVLVRDGSWRVIRLRETLNDLLALERACN